MAEGIEAQQATSLLRESALAGVLTTPMGDVEFKGLSRPVPIVENTSIL